LGFTEGKIRNFNKAFQRKGGKAEMVWTCNKKRRRRASQRHYGMKRSEDVRW
jgi:hypothetical protein